MTGALKLERLAEHREGLSDQRRARVTRLLHLVRLNNGRLTSRRAILLTGWTQRSIERYLIDLAVAGLVHRDYRAEGSGHRWRITDEGLAQLTGAAGT